MADVPLSLAIIGVITPAAAGLLPLTVGWIRDTAREKRAAAELRNAEQSQRALERRSQCVTLLRLARDFRVLVEVTADSTGPDLEKHAGQVRKAAADIASQSDEVEFMVPGAGTEALALAAAARLLAAPLADRRNREHGSSLLSPDFADFDRCLAEFKKAALDAAGEVQERPG
jgi:type II secretory pathway pseudopilin PulG